MSIRSISRKKKSLSPAGDNERIIAKSTCGLTYSEINATLRQRNGEEGLDGSDTLEQVDRPAQNCRSEERAATS